MYRFSMSYARPVLLGLVLLVSGCLPAWTGEECNPHVVAFYVIDGADFEPGLIAEAGYTRITHLERGVDIDPASWVGNEDLTYHGFDPERYILMPLDVEANQSTFVLEHVNGNDTIFFRYNSELGRDSENKCGYTFNITDLEFQWRNEGFSKVPFAPHPRIMGEAGVFQ